MKTLALFILILLSLRALAADKANCYRGDGAFQQEIHGFTVKVAKFPMAQSKGADTLFGCRATITNAAGKTIFHVTDFGMGIAQSGGTLLNGEPGLVLEAFSGGANCCWSYYLVSLGKDPGLITKLLKQSGIGFEKEPSGNLLMNAGDGNFEFFDGLCHACSPVPIVCLELKGKTFVNVSADHVPAYDKQIAEARAELKPDRIAAFLKVSKLDADTRDQFLDTIPEVLNIVLANLYSGREAQAWKALDEMWPAFDRARIKKLVLDTKAKGLFSQINAEKAVAPAKP